MIAENIGVRGVAIVQSIGVQERCECLSATFAANGDNICGR